jgi:hypothetical protein
MGKGGRDFQHNDFHDDLIDDDTGEEEEKQCC